MRPTRRPRRMTGAGLFAASALLLAFASPGLASEEPRTLFEALKKKEVAFEAVAMHGFEKIDITILNLTDRTLTLDPAGSVLLPPDPALQRLGLGAPVDANPDAPLSFYLVVKPRGRWSGTVWAVCLDAEKGVPPNGVPYVLSDSPAEGNALNLLKYWARNPWIRQKTVNDLIWTGQDLGVLKSQVIPARLRKSDVAVWDGTVFWLSGDGLLFRTREDEWVEIGRGFDRVVAGHGLIAGTHRALNGVRILGFTGKTWRFLTLPGIPDEVRTAPGHVLYARIGTDLYRFGPGDERFHPAVPFPVAAFAIQAGEPEPEVFVVEAESGTVRLLQADGGHREFPGGPARRVHATRASVFAEFATGLFVLRGSSWVKVAGPPSRFLAAGETAFFVREGGLHRVGPDGGEPELLPKGREPFLVLETDREADAIYGLDEKGGIWTFEKNEWSFRIRIPGREK